MDRAKEISPPIYNKAMKPYHIHPSPKPITQFSLYTTEKPLQDAMLSIHDSVDTAFYELEYSRILTEWQTSDFAYLRETEFKVGDTAYLENHHWPRRDYAMKVKIIEYVDDIYTLEDSTGELYFSTEDEITHYCPGQKVKASEVSYVREVAIGLSHGLDVGQESITEWQPAPEPEKQTINSGWHYKTPPKDMDIEPIYIPNPLHAQWLTDRSEGKVQAVYKPNIG